MKNFSKAGWNDALEEIDWTILENAKTLDEKAEKFSKLMKRYDLIRTIDDQLT